MDEDLARRPDLITVTEKHDQSVRSVGADIGVRFERSALTKSSASPLSGSVAQFRAQLQEMGVPDEQIAIDRVAHESHGWAVVGVAVAIAVVLLLVTRDILPSALIAGVPFLLRVVGLLGFPYSAECSVRVRAQDSQQAKKVLDLVTSAPTAELGRVSWRYDVTQPSPEWIDACVGRANERARRIAAALGVEIVGVHDYAERWHLPDRDVEPVLVGSGMEAIGEAPMRKARRPSVPDPDFSSEGEAGLVVTIRYRISGFRASGSS